MDLRRRTATLFVVLCLGHVLLISSQVQTRSGGSVLHEATFGGVAKVQYGVGSLFGWIGGLWGNYVGLRGAARENEARVLELEGQLQGERARATRVDSLEAALELKRTVVAPSIAARVIAGNPMPGVLTVNIDRGTEDGIAPNMPVINGKGVVGRVIGKPAAQYATIQLLADRTGWAGAIAERSGVAGGVSGGHPDGLFRFELLSSAADVAAGDRVITSGQDGIYPHGFLIGEVVRIDGSGKNRVVLVGPAVNFARIDVVLVLRTNPSPGAGKQP
jgi:rod shape-determining protein MreC